MKLVNFSAEMSMWRLLLPSTKDVGRCSTIHETNQLIRNPRSHLGRAASPHLTAENNYAMNPHWLQWYAPHLPSRLLFSFLFDDLHHHPAEWIRMPLEMVSGVGRGMGVLDGGRDRLGKFGG